tara:strand:- start:1003 stop:1236 length:234 start_codon:yes stop_codon:yes gene_type:complete
MSQPRFQQAGGHNDGYGENEQTQKAHVINHDGAAQGQHGDRVVEPGRIDDSHRENRRYRLKKMLLICVCAVISGTEG